MLDRIALLAAVAVIVSAIGTAVAFDARDRYQAMGDRAVIERACIQLYPDAPQLCAGPATKVAFVPPKP